MIMQSKNVIADIYTGLVGRIGTQEILSPNEATSVDGYVFDTIEFIEDSVIGAITDQSNNPLTITGFIPSGAKLFGNVSAITLNSGSAIATLRRFELDSLLDSRLDFSNIDNTEYYPIIF